MSRLPQHHAHSSASSLPTSTPSRASRTPTPTQQPAQHPSRSSNSNSNLTAQSPYSSHNSLSSSHSSLAPPSSSSSSSITSLSGQTHKTTSLGAENCLVTVRVRPLTLDESVGRQPTVWVADPSRNRISMLPDYAEKNRKSNTEYYYDMVQSGSDNKYLYERSARNVVWAAMEGMNGTVFAYGQTASGKTYSMMGVDEQPGIIPQAIDDVFSYIREQTEDREYLLRVSYMEIYNETIRDLLAPDQKDLRIHEDRKRGVYVSPLKEEIVTTPKQVMKVIGRGELNRHFGSTEYNDHSSRSHTIFQMVIESRSRNSGVMSPASIRRVGYANSTKLKGSVNISQLNLIDLAGSEKATLDSDRRKEGAYINKSLLTLGNVISKLTEDRNSSHIPYRDSKLTRILQSSLSGNARISVIATVSPAALNTDETTNTLKFAERVKRVQVRAHQNQVLDEKALIQKYKTEIADLRNKLVETNELLEKERAEQDGSSLERSIRQQYEEQLHESQLVRTALKERIDHLTKLILSSTSVTPKAILDWNAPIDTGDKRTSVIIDGLLPHSGVPSSSDTTASTSPDRLSRVGRKSMRLTRQLSDKDFIRKQIAEIDKRDTYIIRLESLISNLKSVQDPQVQAILSELSSTEDDSKGRVSAIQSTLDLKEEVHRLRKQREEMEIVITEQNEKLEMLEAQGLIPSFGGPHLSREAGSLMFDESPKYREMSLIIADQREAIDEKDMLIRALKTQISDLRNQVRTLELNEFEQFEQMEQMAAGAYVQQQGQHLQDSVGEQRDDTGEKGSLDSVRSHASLKRPQLTTEGVSTRLRETEAALERERRMRQAEQKSSVERIAMLETELTMLRAELSVSKMVVSSN